MALCEMCGRETKLLTADVEGVELNVCSGCAKYGKVKKKVQVSLQQPSFKSKFPSRREQPEYKVVSNYSSLIRGAREGKGMKQEDFAKFLNEKESIVAKWEGSSLSPRIDVARRIGRLLGINLVEREKAESVELKKNKGSEGFTLGDFVKVRKRK